MFETIEESAFSENKRFYGRLRPQVLVRRMLTAGHDPAGRNEDRRRPPRVSIIRSASPSYQLRSLYSCGVQSPFSLRGNSAVRFPLGASIAKSSSDLPELIAAASQRGFKPRPPTSPKDFPDYGILELPPDQRMTSFPVGKRQA
jgi:hypothetical protein